MNLFILGATGNIGNQTFDVIRSAKESYNVISVSGNYNIRKMKDIIVEFSPKYVSMGKRDDVLKLKKLYPHIEYGYGNSGLIKAATYGKLGNDLVLNAVVGSVGLEPTIEAIKKGRNIALANKETLVIGGELINPLLEKYNVTLIPIDSEHSAIMQCMNGEDKATVKSLIITASGGSFRDKTRKELNRVTVKDALNHPNWDMGAKITIDSATMMNKGLEVIEAHHLFDVAYSDIKTVLHKESIIHSLVEYNDCSMIAHLGNPDMRVPISYAINYPSRVEYKGKRLDLVALGSLHFEELDIERFPMLGYAYDAGQQGGLMPTVLNAANEAAVQLFLNGKITFLQIEEIVLKCLNIFENDLELSLESILERDNLVKDYVLRTYS
ncbi:MAG: 1-deoxy-D-xylulose-5-phosphate reductoisomerase [Candidatus Izimaplasma sp.]|nr:1-deoxy-D-xylulose-5-phosphate reductoisomerase [Candidatus Izimaplasma bacterium]